MTPMTQALPRSRLFNLLMQILLAAVWGLFSYAHFKKFLETQDLALLVLCIAEAFVVLFFIIRTEPKSVSTDFLDWIVAIVGTFSPLFLRPSSWGIFPAASELMLIGVTIQLMGMISLNRSFALVAAKREIKTTGIYRYIRHPLYASYFLTLGAYVLVYTTWWNVCIYTLAMACMIVRMSREEKFLAQDPLYREYMHQVRYRLLPRVY